MQNIGVPKYPEYWFDSGDRVTVFETDREEIDGVPHTLLYMTLPQWVIQKNMIPEKKLTKSFTRLGSITRAYPTDLIEQKSHSPQKTVYFVHCNFDGTLSTGTGKKNRLAYQNLQLRQELSFNKLELERLTRELRESKERNKILDDDSP